MMSPADPSKRFRLEDLHTEGAVWFFSADEVQAAFLKLDERVEPAEVPSGLYRYWYVE